MFDYERNVSGSWEGDGHPDKEKCPWKIGQTVYLVNNENTKSKNGSTINLYYLGNKFVIQAIQFGRYSIYARLTLGVGLTGSSIISGIHQDDLNKHNTFVHPFKNIPDWLSDMTKYNFCGDSMHSGHFALYIANKKDDESWGDLSNKCNEYNLDGICDNCEDGDCDNCNRVEEIIVDRHLPIEGFINTNTSCWQDGMDLWRAVLENFDSHPTRLAILLPKDDIYDYYLHDPNIHYDIFSNIQKFIKYMKLAKALPSEIQVPDDTMDGKNLMFKVNLEKISPNRMYWYLCTLRAPIQFPDIVPLTVELIEEYNFDPLLGYIMAQVIHPTFYGGHAVVDSPSLRLNGGGIRRDNSNTDHLKKCEQVLRNPVIYNLPHLGNVLKFTIRSHKFLTTNTSEYVTSAETVKGWALNRHLLFDVFDNDDTWNHVSSSQNSPSFKIRFKIPEGLSSMNINTFSVAERQLIL